MKGRFEWNLKEGPNVLFNWYKGIIFHSWKNSSWSLFIHELWRLFTLFRMSTFCRPPFSYPLQKILCFFLELELFHEKEVWIVSKTLITWVGTGAIRAGKIIFEIAKFLKTTIHPSRVMFQYRQRFNKLCTSETILRKLHSSFILLLYEKKYLKS